MRVTREEYLDLQEDGFKYDVIDGVMTMAPSPYFEHNLRATNLLARLHSYLKETDSGLVANETDVLLPDGGDPLRPDISLIMKQNLQIIKGHIHGTPDLIVEVLSESTRERDLGVKADRYLKCGVREYWILDPEDKTMQLWLNRKDHWEKKNDPELASELLPGLLISRAEIFA